MTDLDFFRFGSESIFFFLDRLILDILFHLPLQMVLNTLDKKGGQDLNLVVVWCVRMLFNQNWSFFNYLYFVE